MVGPAWDVQVHTSCFDPDAAQRRIRVREEGDTANYQLFLFLSGRDLPYVQDVTYYLHPTFNNPRRSVRRTPDNPTCKLEIWAWGEFPMHTLVRLKSGEELDVRHNFEFSAQVERAKRESPEIFEYM